MCVCVSVLGLCWNDTAADTRSKESSSKNSERARETPGITPLRGDRTYPWVTSHLRISPWGTHQHHSFMATIKCDGGKGEGGKHVIKWCIGSLQRQGSVTGHKGKPMLSGEKHRSNCVCSNDMRCGVLLKCYRSFVSRSASRSPNWHVWLVCSFYKCIDLIWQISPSIEIAWLHIWIMIYL